ncbi:MAG TPA: hydantoinase B/oxoprolinase family protein, partial [Burkholderiales bacterium]|nr:hydantoinase B/oxoprolinase family protein [Burkholderiales bacterium]
GFRDVLEIRRENKYEMYDVALDLPRPLVPRRWCIEVTERMDARGTPLVPLDVEQLQRAVDQLTSEGVESLALVFLHAYANPEHERAAVNAIRACFPEVFVSASHEVAPEIREFERASTTAANAYIQPLAARYLERLADDIAALGISAPLFLMLSNGGLTHVEEARRVPVRLLESGPAAGALAAAFFARRSGIDDVLAFDMGGTTAKLAVVERGEPLVSYHFEAAREKRFTPGSGHPIRISTIELIEIGAGGGSIARVDDLGLIKVGPQSASAVPGPACYQRGGSEPTVTDANLHLGYLNPDFFAGGSIPISRAAADRALAPIAERTGLGITDVAWGIHDIVNESMASAARVHVAERGKDPRRHALLVTGGGGPIHGSEVARKLGISTIVCPPAAGVASALGLLMAPARVDRVATLAQRLSQVDWTHLEAVFASLEHDARALIAQSGIDATNVSVDRLADMRYVGQGFELIVKLPSGPYDAQRREGIAAAFEEAYRQIFSQVLSDIPIELINVRVTVRARAAASELELTNAANAQARGALKGRRAVYDPQRRAFVDTAVYDRARLAAGVRIDGPAIVEEPESTLVLGHDSSFVIDSAGNLIVTIATTRQQAIAGAFDAITLEVLWRRLITSVDEASAALVRSAFSTVLRESDDFSCVLTDERGRSVAQATKSIPAFIGSLPATVKHFLAHFGKEGLQPGDILITNDPWLGTGHLFDINVAKPIFRGEWLVGFSASTAHASDIGGNLDAHSVRDVFEEGFILPRMKLFRRGEVDESVLALLRANVRVPEQVIGDLFAQVNALNLMEARLHSVMDEFGLTTLSGLADEICGRSERAMRDAIRALPKGTWHYSFETDGTDTPVHVQTAVTIDDDRVHIDFAGSSLQVRAPINVPMPYTYAFTAYAVKCIAAPEGPNNDGAFAPITVSAPKGSILNNTFPSSGGQRVCTGHYLPVAVFAALGDIVPERVAAGAGSPLWSFLQSGVRDGRPYANKVFINGGMGATAHKDGANVLSWPSNVACTPTEMMEQQAPLRLHYKQIRKGAGGAGRHRGGAGQELLFESLSEDPIQITFNADRTRNPAPGLGGGECGACGEIRLNGELRNSRQQLILGKGDKLLVRTPAGGGFGPSVQRDLKLIERDRLEGYID